MELIIKLIIVLAVGTLAGYVIVIFLEFFRRPNPEDIREDCSPLRFGFTPYNMDDGQYYMYVNYPACLWTSKQHDCYYLQFGTDPTERKFPKPLSSMDLENIIITTHKYYNSKSTSNEKESNSSDTLRPKETKEL